MTRQLGDRRSRIRLEVVGNLWGALDIEDVARVVNISDTGVLIAMRSAPPPDSVQAIRLRLEGREVTVTARVRHCRQVAGPGGSPEYLVGLEIVGTDSSSYAVP
jgi:hypothetical protein